MIKGKLLMIYLTFVNGMWKLLILYVASLAFSVRNFSNKTTPPIYTNQGSKNFSKGTKTSREDSE